MVALVVGGFVVLWALRLFLRASGLACKAWCGCCAATQTGGVTEEFVDVVVVRPTLPESKFTQFDRLDLVLLAADDCRLIILMLLIVHYSLAGDLEGFDD